MDRAFVEVEPACSGVEERIDRLDDRRAAVAGVDAHGLVEVGRLGEARPGVALGELRQQQQHRDVHDAGADQADQEHVEEPKHRSRP